MQVYALAMTCTVRIRKFHFLPILGLEAVSSLGDRPCLYFPACPRSLLSGWPRAGVCSSVCHVVGAPREAVEQAESWHSCKSKGARWCSCAENIDSVSLGQQSIFGQAKQKHSYREWLLGVTEGEDGTGCGCWETRGGVWIWLTPLGELDILGSLTTTVTFVLPLLVAPPKRAILAICFACIFFLLHVHIHK